MLAKVMMEAAGSVGRQRSSLTFDAVGGTAPSGFASSGDAYIVGQPRCYFIRI